MCDLCGKRDCQNELKHLVHKMLEPEVHKRFPNLRFVLHPNSLHVVRPKTTGVTDVLKVGFYNDRMKVWRCIPRYETGPIEVLAADPDFISQIIDVLTGRTLITFLGSKY